jgi:hypothetical protein
MTVTPTWDLFVGIIFVIGMVYGFALQKERVFTSLLAVYVGIVITSIWGQKFFDFFQGKNMIMNSVWIQSNAKPSTINIIIFLAIVALVTAKAPIGLLRSWSIVSPLETIAYSLINTALLLCTILRNLPPETQNHILEQSKFLVKLNNFYGILLVAPLVLLILITNRRGGDA